MTRLQVFDGQDGLQTDWNLRANVLSEESRPAEKGWYFSFGFGQAVKTAGRKISIFLR